jgi:hypothetical protein
MISGHVKYLDSFGFQCEDLPNRVFGFQKDSRSVAPPHVNNIPKQNEVRKIILLRELIKERVERCLVAICITQVMVGGDDNSHNITPE